MKTVTRPNQNTAAPRNSTRINAPLPQRAKILVLFGTRPEAIKLAPIIRELKKHGTFQTIVVSSSQHTDLLAPFLKIFDLKPDYDLRVMTENQTLNEVFARVLSAFDAILESENPDVVLVQGDTTTALAGALCAFNRRIKVGHVEAGLRSGDINSPFPEEMNRRMISQAAAFHFCATALNKENLLRENTDEKNIFVTGNPVVDALHYILENEQPSVRITRLIEETKNFKRVLLTTHRRESFGAKMSQNAKTLREFVEENPDVALIFPVHPNPQVRKMTGRHFIDHPRIFLIEPLDYADFIALMKTAWLIISDSGGVQEEAPSLGVPLLILRDNTERPEAIASGAARLVGKKSLKNLLETNYNETGWLDSLARIENPFGDGKAAQRIVRVLAESFNAKSQELENAKGSSQEFCRLISSASPFLY